jgi:hypothetical protein
MLVMRNFGYLGLHTIVDNKSSLARERLVDFTGEIQLRRRTEDDFVERKSRAPEPFDSFRLDLPPWHRNYIAEPATNGGRSVTEPMTPEVNEESCMELDLYAQELAPLPLLLGPPRISQAPHAGITQRRSNHEDIEPTYFTTFCNELLCHPRLLHNCQRGRISIKVEVRSMEWNESFNSYVAHLPSKEVGPSIHNLRRGPFLVHSTFTSCTPSRSDHQFIDEFKIKLPLHFNLTGPTEKSCVLSLFFTVYRVRTGSKNKWKRGAKKLFGSSILDSVGNVEDIEQSDRIDQVACGFLPINSNSCVLENGMHDVRIAYYARAPSNDMVQQRVIPSDSLVLREMSPEDSACIGRDESIAEETTITNDSLVSDRHKDIDATMRTDSASDLLSMNEDSVVSGKGGKNKDPISLSVSIK